MAGLRNSFTLLSWKFSFNCVFCLKRGLDSFICEASQLGRIFLPTYLYAQTVSLEHESLGLRKSSHTSTYTCVHSHTHTCTLTLKIEAAILLTLVNAPHPRQLDLHIFNVLFFSSLLSFPSLHFFPPFLCLSLLSESGLSGTRRRACSACQEGVFVSKSKEKKTG